MRTIFLLFVLALPTAAHAGFHEVARFQPGGEGGWDYAAFHEGRLYVARGNRVQVIDARGFVSTSYYNADNEVVLSVDNAGYATTFVYDANGNIVSQTLYATALTLPLDPTVQPDGCPPRHTHCLDQWDPVRRAHMYSRLWTSTHLHSVPSRRILRHTQSPWRRSRCCEWRSSFLRTRCS